MENAVTVKGRQVQKHDIEANWIKAGNATNPFIPLKGELIIYDIEVDLEGNLLELPEGRNEAITYARQKIGDGIHNVNELPFITETLLKESGLEVTKTNSIVQTSNEAIGDHSISLGQFNKTMSECSSCIGLMNLTGVQFNNPISCTVIDAVINDVTGYADITITDFEESSLSVEDYVVIYASDYYFSSKVMGISYDGDNCILHCFNHNAVHSIKSALSKSLPIIIYRIDESNLSESCHTESIEGAYNIAAALGEEAMCSRVTHIEGHTNIGFGQYNHLEGVRNRALGQTEITHIEGRFNTVDAEEQDVTISHLEGEYNTDIKSSHTHIEGYKNKVVDSRHVHAEGYLHNVTNSENVHVSGRENTVLDSSRVTVQGSGLKVSAHSQVVLGTFNENNPDAAFIFGYGTGERKNAVEILKDGEFKYLDANKNLVSINEVHNSLQSNIDNIIYNKVDSFLINSGSDIFPLITPYDHKYISVDGADKLIIKSRNLLNNNYISGTDKILSGLTFINDDGKLTVSGTYEGNAWPQYYLHNKYNVNGLELLDNHTYKFGLMYDEGETRTAILRFTYRETEDGSDITLITKTSESPIVIEWKPGYKFINMLIQTGKSDYDNFNIYPYMTDSIYDFEKNLQTWSPYREVSYIKPATVIEITEPIDAYLLIECKSSSQINFYEKNDFASKEDLNEFEKDFNTRLEDLESASLEKFSEINNIKAITSDIESRVSNLENLTLLYPEITSTDCEKVVPADVGTPARIKSIGGAAVFSNNLLDPSKFTSDNTNITVNNDGSITFVIPANSWAQIKLPSLPEGKYYWTYLEEVVGGVLSDAGLKVGGNYIYRGEFFEVTSSEQELYYGVENMDWGSGMTGTTDVTVTEKLMISREELPFEPYFPPKNVEVERIESIGANIIPFPYNYKGKVMDVGYTETINGVTFEILENGLISERGTSTGKVTFNFWQTIMPAGTYYISGKYASGGGSLIAAYNYSTVNDSYPQNGTGTINPKIKHVGGAFGARIAIDSGVTVNSVFSPIITKDVYVENFVPYSAEPIDTLEIPEAVRSKEGYGREGSYITFVDDTATLTVTKDENLAELTEPSVTDISDLFSESNKLQVQQGGIIRFVNEHKMPIPNTVGFIKRKE